MRDLAGVRLFWQRFKKAQRGTTAVIFGIMVIPLIAITGGVVDYGRAVKTKSQLNSALDAAVLAAMMQYSLDEDTDYKKVIEDYIRKNLAKTDKRFQGEELDITIPDISEDGEMKAAISTKVETNFLKLVGFDEFDVHVEAASKVGGSAIEVALVLDNTGSMAGSKIEDLKGAARDLLDILMPEDADNSSGNVKFSIVPFADYVNIGVDNRYEPGLDIPEAYSVMSVPAGEHCWNEYPDSTRECENNPVPGTCYNDGVPYDCMQDNWTCTGDQGDPVEHCEDQEAQYRNYDWYGCVGSREHDLNTRDDDYSTGVPGIMYEWNWCQQISPVTRLTADRDTILAGIDNMNAQRETYIPAGLMWGWRTLSPVTPFADGSPYSDGAVRKVIVLMTDGANTKSAWGKWNGLESESVWWKKKLGWRSVNNASDVFGHNGSNAADANNITAEVCNNIRDRGIMVFTIGFEIEADSEIETLMKNCAGNGGKYFDASDGEALSDAFKEIGISLLNLRLSQ